LGLCNPQLPVSISADGWLAPVARCQSPNFDARPQAATVDALIVHAISLPPQVYGGQYVQAFFSNQLPVGEHEYFATIASLRVSAHCLIERDGQLTQFVSFADRAWHAGQSSLEGRPACNDFSIGIELEGCDEHAFTSVQYQVLAHVTRLLCFQYPSLSADRIVGHSDIAPGRKTDPGPNFDWLRFRQMVAND